MGRYIVSFIGKEAATTAKASTLSLESLGTCSSFQAERVLNFYLTREAYFANSGVPGLEFRVDLSFNQL